MLSFSFCNESQAHFCSSWCRGRSEKSRKEICFLARNLFANSKSVTVKERDTVTNLSTWSHLTNQSMIPESGIMKRRNQRHFSRLRRPFPLPSPPLGPLSWPIFFPVARFLPFPHSGAWSQARSSRFPHTRNTKAANSKTFPSNCVTIQLTVRAWSRLLSRYYMKGAKGAAIFIQRLVAVYLFLAWFIRRA